MKAGRIKITNKLIATALKFPPDWIIEEIIQSRDRYDIIEGGISEMLISGNDFPETNNRGDAEEVELICHKEVLRYEVKKI